MMFEPNEDEARRDQALNHATMSTSSHEVHHMERGTELILERAKAFEKYLKDGDRKLQIENDPPAPQGLFGTYQDGGLDSGSS